MSPIDRRRLMIAAWMAPSASPTVQSAADRFITLTGLDIPGALKAFEEWQPDLSIPNDMVRRVAWPSIARGLWATFVIAPIALPRLFEMADLTLGYTESGYSLPADEERTYPVEMTLLIGRKAEVQKVAALAESLGCRVIFTRRYIFGPVFKTT